jgi:CBS-domain-containing membrane protein
MSPKLVYLEEGVRARTALKFILDFGITAVPVVDALHQPIGVVSLRDLVDPQKADDPVSKPARTINVDESIESAGRALASANVHHLVVVDEKGRAVGMISTIDVIRGLLGIDAAHPKAIERF